MDKATTQLKGAQNGGCQHWLNNRIYINVLHTYICRYIHVSCALKWQRHVRQIEKSHLDARRRCLSRLKRSWNWDTDWIGRCCCCCCWSAAWRRQLPVAFAGRVWAEGEWQFVRLNVAHCRQWKHHIHLVQATKNELYDSQMTGTHTHTHHHTHTQTYIGHANSPGIHVTPSGAWPVSAFSRRNETSNWTAYLTLCV